MNHLNREEFGSDFNSIRIENNISNKRFPANSLLFGCGRQALNFLLKYHLNKSEWKRIFVPEYFCYEVIESIINTGIEIKFYKDSPLINEKNQIANLKFKSGDVLLRMNYFGMRKFRDNSLIPVPVIEDHTHALFSDWAINSNADWCIASLRKNIPIPDGGILWTNRNHYINKDINESLSHNKLMSIRFDAMELKSKYLNNSLDIDKNMFLDIFKKTEKCFQIDKEFSISKVSKSIMSNIPLDIEKYKRENFKYICNLIDQSHISILKGETLFNPFSLVILFRTNKIRNLVRENLIKNNIFPAILWEITNENASESVISFSERMLSIHIDYRYSNEDLLNMSKIINKAIKIYCYVI